MENLLASMYEWLKVALQYIALPYLIAFVFSAYAFKDPLCALLNWAFFRKTPRVSPSMHWVVFIIGTLVALPFLFIPSWRPDILVKVPNEGDPVVYNSYGLRLFVTYCVGTVLHDLIIYRIIKLFKPKEE